MFTRPCGSPEDRARQGQILAALATAIDAGLLRTTLRQELGPITAENLRRAHGRLEGGRTIGKLALAGWA
jgi:NADPH2:quinone reductase